MGTFAEEPFHFLLHVLYLVQYSALTVAVVVSFIYFQYRERKTFGGWKGLLSSHALIHSLLIIYDVIQVFRSQMALFHTSVTDGISAFLYYFKDGFSIFVICVILYVFASNLVSEERSKILIYILAAFVIFFQAMSVVFAIIRLSVMGFDSDAEYSQGLLAYDISYALVMFILFCFFVFVSILLYKKNPTLRLAAGSLFLAEVMFLAILHRIAYCVASFGVSDFVFELVIFLYRFFGFGINLWVLIFFWGRRDIYDEGIGSIDPSDITNESPAENQVFEQI